MALQRVAGKTREDVEEPVVTQFREQGLLIRQCVLSNDARCGIWNARPNQTLARQESVGLHGEKFILRRAGTEDDPEHRLWCRVAHTLGKLCSISKTVNDVPKILGELNTDLLCRRCNILTRKLNSPVPWLALREEDVLD